MKKILIVLVIALAVAGLWMVKNGVEKPLENSTIEVDAISGAAPSIETEEKAVSTEYP